MDKKKIHVYMYVQMYLSLLIIVSHIFDLFDSQLHAIFSRSSDLNVA